MRILIIDDNPHDADLTQYTLKKAIRAEFDYVENFKKFKQIFNPDKYAAVISDYALSDCLGTDVLLYVRALEPEIPFIIISGTIGEEEVVRVLHLGATDYVLKDNIEKLPIALLRALKEAETKKETQKALEKLEQNEKRFRALIEKSSDIKTLITTDGKLLYGSPAFTNILGYSPDEYINTSNVALVHPDDIGELKENIQHIKRTPGSSFYTKYRLHDKNGNWRWFEGTITNLLHDEHINALVSNFRDITEREKAEKELKSTHERLLFHLENTPLGFIEWDNKLNIKTCSKRAEEIFGWKKMECMEGEISGLSHVYKDDLPWVTKIAEQLLSGEIERNRVQHRNITQEGKVIWCEWFNSVSKDEKGRVISCMSLVQDITDRKEAEAKILESEKKLNEAQALALIGNWEIDLTNNTNVWSDELYKIFGTNREVVPSPELFLPYIHPDDSEFTNKKMEEAFSSFTDSSFNFRFIPKNGKVRYGYSEYKFEFDQNKKPVRLYGIVQDITDRKKAEEKIQESEKKLNEAQAMALIGNWDIDMTTNIHIWSDELYKIFGVDKDETIPSKELFFSYIHPEDREFANKKMEETFSSLTKSTFNFRFIRNDGVVRHGYAESKFDFDKNGSPLRLYGIIQDVTERKKSEKEILKKNRQLTDLSNHLQNIREEERTNVAREIHDELGQQLTAMKMDIDWVLHKQKNSEIPVVTKLQDMLKMSDGFINTVRRISSDLRPAIIDDLGLIATIEWKCADFEEKMGIPCQFISTVKEKNFNKHFSINVYRILQETLTNVSRHAEAEAVTVLLTENGKEMILEIIDDGKGITKDNIRNSKRLGILGMKERVSLLDGELIINGAENKGTCVKLILPLKNEYINS